MVVRLSNTSFLDPELALLPMIKQAGNPDGLGTCYRKIGNASHDTGITAHVCSREITTEYGKTEV